MHMVLQLARSQLIPSGFCCTLGFEQHGAKRRRFHAESVQQRKRHGYHVIRRGRQCAARFAVVR